MHARCIPLLAAATLLAGCVITTVTGPAQYESRSFDRQSVGHMRLELHMGAGDLRVGSGTSKLMQTYFTYNVPSWKPEIRQSGSPSQADFTISQPEGIQNLGGNNKYQWDVRLAQDVPLDLVVHFGAGQARLDLGALTLHDVEVHMGVGQLEMDLRGHPAKDYNVEIHGGIGQATVWLPSSAGVYAEAHGGIGEISTRGLHKTGGHYENDAYETAKVKVHVQITGGIGQITLIGD
jgi:hypothetical protein